jgi:hypothetical protein
VDTSGLQIAVVDIDLDGGTYWWISLLMP